MREEEKNVARQNSKKVSLKLFQMTMMNNELLFFQYKKTLSLQLYFLFLLLLNKKQGMFE